MRMNHATMYARLLEGDATCNGRFFTGVLTTGIYCLPSCKARKPKVENVRFFPSCEAARAAGLRACKKCHPDDFARGADPILADIEILVAEIRANPAGFADVRAVVRRSGFGATRLFELFRQHYQRTPADILVRARLEAAKQLLLAGDAGVLAVAAAAGFESPSVFHEHFRSATGMTPGAYRELRAASSFTVALPDDYPLPYLRRALSRDAHSVTEKLEGNHYTTAVQLTSGPAVLTAQIGADAVVVQIDPVMATNQRVGPALAAVPSRGGRHTLDGMPAPRRARGPELVERASGSPANDSIVTVPEGIRCVAAEAHAIIVGLLGLDQDAAGFARLARKLGLARLVAGRTGMRIAQTPSIFDGLLWSIIGQQINFPFASQLKRRLIELTGTRLPNGLFTPPTPAAVAALDPGELLPLQFSRQKAAYVTATARLVAAGTLDLPALGTMSATRAERTLLDVHGLGPWSVNYLMMRALGFPDCVPLGDTGVTSGLLALLKLEERPDVAATRRLMGMFSPCRSLATAHLWQFNQPVPA